MVNIVDNGGKACLPSWPEGEYLFMDGIAININYAFGVPNRYVPSDIDIDSEEWQEVP